MKDRILVKLKEAYPDCISGAQLAESLGISRVAVWKHIESLKESGYEIVAKKGRGYCLEHPEQAIIPVLISENLADPHWGTPVFYTGQTQSTNLWARQLLEDQHLPEGTLIIASQQTGGRGRLGRTWASPRGGLYFTLILRPALNLKNASLLSLVMAVACARSLRQHTGCACRIKWPNDIFIQGRKVGGILLEARGEMDRLDYVIAGIGINVNLSSQDFPEEVRHLAVSLAMVAGHSFDLNQLLVSLLEDLRQDYYLFLQKGFQPFREVYQEYCIHWQQPIVVNTGKELIQGIHRDLDVNGSLLVETADGEITSISTGDVQLISYQEE